MNTKDLKEEFENQSFVRVMKQAQDFNEAQYELLCKLWLSKFQAREDELKEKIEGMKRVYEEDGNLAANPAKWEISIINYNAGLAKALEIINTTVREK